MSPTPTSDCFGGPGAHVQCAECGMDLCQGGGYLTEDGTRYCGNHRFRTTCPTCKGEGEVRRVVAT